MTNELAEEYLVQHGQSGFLGRFRNRCSSAFGRGDRVVIQSLRGLELGTVLERAAPRFANLMEPVPSGDLVRPITSDDAATLEKLNRRSQQLVEDAQRRVAEREWPISILDGEILFDEKQAILQAIHWSHYDITPLLDELSAHHSIRVLLIDLTAPPAPKTTGCGADKCGSGGCGSCSSGGGGCSTGSCSSGKVKDAKELTAYFADLRGKMEADARRVALKH